MYKSGKQIVERKQAQLPRWHKCHGCVWGSVLQQKVLCMRLPCVRDRSAGKQGCLSSREG